MKVLKAPDYKDWKQVCTCSRCKAELEYTISDITGCYDAGDCRDPGGGSSWYYTITCAVCTQVLSVAKSVMTPHIEWLVQQKKKDNGPYGGGYFDR